MTAYEKYNAYDELVDALNNALDALDEIPDYDKELESALASAVEYYADQRDSIADEAEAERKREQHELYIEWLYSR